MRRVADREPGKVTEVLLEHRDMNKKEAAAEAVEQGFADSVANDGPKAQAQWDLSVYAHAPKPPSKPDPEHRAIDKGAYLRPIDALLTA